MNLITTKLNMLDLAGQSMCLGSESGNAIYLKLCEQVPSSTQCLEISFKGMTGVDACCIRNSVAAYAMIFQNRLGVIITNVENIDVLENLQYGFKAKSLPVIVKNEDGSGCVFMNDTSFNQPALLRTYLRREITSSILANDLQVSVPNASNKLKQLFKLGLLHCYQSTAESGGKEFIYTPYLQTHALHFR